MPFTGKVISMPGKTCWQLVSSSCLSKRWGVFARWRDHGPEIVVYKMNEKLIIQAEIGNVKV